MQPPYRPSSKAKPVEREWLYGLNPAFEVLRAGRRRVHRLILNTSARGQARLKKLARYAERLRVPLVWYEKGRLTDLCRTSEHQGAVLEVSPFPYASAAEFLQEPRSILLDNVEDPHNVGAILRSAEIFGFRAAGLPAKGVPGVYPSVVKASAGASEHLVIHRPTHSVAAGKAALEAGYFVAALDRRGNITLDELAERNPQKLLLVIGGEDQSVGQFLLNESHAILSLPQSGRITSLNASVAAGIALWSLRDKQSELNDASSAADRSKAPEETPAQGTEAEPEA